MSETKQPYQVAGSPAGEEEPVLNSTEEPRPEVPPEPVEGPAEGPVTEVLAIARYLIATLTEGQLAKKLGCDRLEARRRVAEFLNVAIANAGVPITRIGILESRVAALTTQVTRHRLAEAKATELLQAERDRVHDLNNQVQQHLFNISDLTQDLETERQHVAHLARVARYAYDLAGLAPIRVWDTESDAELSAEVLRRLAAEALGLPEEVE